MTNKTLPYFLIENTDLNVDKIYNHQNPYTNLYASSVKFWNNKEIKSLLKKIALSMNKLLTAGRSHCTRTFTKP